MFLWCHIWLVLSYVKLARDLHWCINFGSLNLLFQIRLFHTKICSCINRALCAWKIMTTSQMKKYRVPPEDKGFYKWGVGGHGFCPRGSSWGDQCWLCGFAQAIPLYVLSFSHKLWFKSFVTNWTLNSGSFRMKSKCAPPFHRLPLNLMFYVCTEISLPSTEQTLPHSHSPLTWSRQSKEYTI